LVGSSRHARAEPARELGQAAVPEPRDRRRLRLRQLDAERHLRELVERQREDHAVGLHLERRGVALERDPEPLGARRLHRDELRAGPHLRAPDRAEKRVHERVGAVAHHEPAARRDRQIDRLGVGRDAQQKVERVDLVGPGAVVEHARGLEHAAAEVVGRDAGQVEPPLHAQGVEPRVGVERGGGEDGLASAAVAADRDGDRGCVAAIRGRGREVRVGDRERVVELGDRAERLDGFLGDGLEGSQQVGLGHDLAVEEQHRGGELVRGLGRGREGNAELGGEVAKRLVLEAHELGPELAAHVGREAGLGAEGVTVGTDAAARARGGLVQDGGQAVVLAQAVGAVQAREPGADHDHARPLRLDLGLRKLAAA
jgi:hypothetical protein